MRVMLLGLIMPLMLAARPLSVTEMLSKAGGSCMKGCTTPDKLHWWGKMIGEAGCEELAIALSNQSTRLANLLIGGNDVGDRCMVALAKLAGQGKLLKLQALGLSRNLITDKGCEALAGALARGEMPAMRDLYLSNNKQLGDRCAAALGDAISRGGLRSLARVSWGDSTMTDVGLTALLAAVRSGSSPSLRELTLNNNSVLCTAQRRAALLSAIGATASADPVEAAQGQLGAALGKSAKRKLRQGRQLARGALGGALGGAITLTLGKSRCAVEPSVPAAPEASTGRRRTLLMTLAPRGGAGGADAAIAKQIQVHVSFSFDV